MEVRIAGGETRRLRDVDSRTPFSSVGEMVQGDRGEGEAAGRLTEFRVLDGAGEESGSEVRGYVWAVADGYCRTIIS